MTLTPKACSVHTHADLCDGRDSLEAMAAAAFDAGVRYYGVSCHSHTPLATDEGFTLPANMMEYRRQVLAVREQYRGRMEVLLGLEWDSQSDVLPKGFDYWIGSAHHLYGKNTGKYYEIDFRPQDLWDCINDDFDADPLAAVEAYFAEVEKVAALKPDILAHIDLIKKLNAKGEFFDEESPRYKAAALKALQAAKDNDCLLEVNTGGVYRGYRKDFYPGPWLLGEWQKMGGKVIITSDSHDIASLTYGFDEAAAAIKAAGFTSVEVLTGHGFETQEL